ncbi:MAG: bifunctional aspartate kinase/homoserine dehydrogenase I [Bacteroidales bacterium]
MKKVLKFGGSSLSGPPALNTLLEVISSNLKDKNEVLIVCSALEGVTNYINEMVELAIAGNNVSARVKELEDMHYKLVRTHLEVRRQNQVLLGLKLYFNQLDEMLSGIMALGEVSLRTIDRALSYGELCSAYLFTSFVEQYCGKAVFADTRQLIKTDSNFGQANINEEACNILINKFIADNKDAIPVFTGFIASTETGITTTLGRGGSDYTAAIVASATGAGEIQIWTNVDGIMTADPRMVTKAFSIPRLSYSEAVELSYFGAKVIHPPTMFPARTNNIPIIIKNSFNPLFEGTVIASESSKADSLIKGISCISEICLVTLQGGAMVGEKGFSGRLFSRLATEGINVFLITQASSQHSISIAIAPRDIVTARRAINREFEQDFETGRLDKPDFDDSLSIIAVVGENMRHKRGLSGKVFSSLGRSGVNVIAIAQGSSELNISVVIDRMDISKAMNSIHDAMFLSPVKTLNVFFCGVGNIGSTLLRQIESHMGYLEEKRHIKLNLTGICNSKAFHFNQEGISVSEWKKALSESGRPGKVSDFIEEAFSLNLPNSVFVDNTGSKEVPALYNRLFEKSFSVVTCNKIGNTGNYISYHKSKETAGRFGVDYWYETTVGAGLPIIKTIQELLVSGDEIIKVEAILSGTISFVFNNYRGERTFAEVVKMAQQNGFTEPDPRDDLSGLDFARKMLILARETGLPTEIEEIDLQPILPDNCLQAASVDDFYRELEVSEPFFNELKTKAALENKVMHYVGMLSEGKVKIQLLMLDSSHPFYNLSGSDNIISITTNRYLYNPMVIKGPGAGAEVTAAGVLADMVRVAAD